MYEISATIEDSNLALEDHHRHGHDVQSLRMVCCKASHLCLSDGFGSCIDIFVGQIQQDERMESIVRGTPVDVLTDSQTFWIGTRRAVGKTYLRRPMELGTSLKREIVFTITAASGDCVVRLTMACDCSQALCRPVPCRIDGAVARV